MSKKNPNIALVLSLIIVGLGQIYLGEIKRGLIFLVVIIVLSVILSMFGLVWIAGIVSLYSAYDAYELAKKK